MAKLDRLARNARHLLEITDQLHAKGSTLQIQNLGIDTAIPTGKLMLTMIGAIATFDA
ncbi:recombinase family protein [Aeromonas dhakensis]|uniref:recombinase family protein n=1 Tax=Aeromonas dhakensis TaxID=196024 RepID=UPI00227CC627|nr:recombinase family protein [Aeromonas dhakensis]WAF75655.1 recombinase family protein [Aeromonas dhakensis]